MEARAAAYAKQRCRRIPDAGDNHISIGTGTSEVGLLLNLAR
jgi:hypothetical protein